MIGYPTDFKHTGHIGSGDMDSDANSNCVPVSLYIYNDLLNEKLFWDQQLKCVVRCNQSAVEILKWVTGKNNDIVGIDYMI